MHVTFWGTRGSIAKAGPSTVRYGGNTSCVEVRSDSGTLLVIDCGTGAHGLGVDLCARSGGKPVNGNLLIGHTHWDHIQGLPFFAPVLQPGNHWNIYGPRGLGDSLSETLAGQMQYSYFPATIDQLGADVEYHDLVEGRFTIDDVSITTHYLNHPALTLGYRIEVDGAVVVYSSDHEPHDRRLAAGGDVASSPNDRVHAAFLDSADLVIHDAQYLAGEYAPKANWGHSTVEYVVDAAGFAAVRRLALFHHDPTRDDDQVDALVANARRLASKHGYETDVFAAAEGMTIELRGESDDRGSVRAHRAATMRPAIADEPHGVLIAVGDPDIEATLSEAAAAEDLELTVVSDVALALAAVADARPSLVLFDDDPAGDTLARSIRAFDPPYGAGVGLVPVTRAHHRHESGFDVTDWLVWPASAGYVRTKLHAWLLRRACKWQIAPMPEHEAERIAALRSLDVLDTQPEERFDRYTKLASDAFDVPIALISLVDTDRQWFKSRHGLDAEETPRDLSVCAHTILRDDVFQVPDALHDDRFADNPLVVGDPRVRFYAGVPLTLSDGSNVGTLCVLDYRPRLLDDTQLIELRRLGDLVIGELEAD